MAPRKFVVFLRKVLQSNATQSELVLGVTVLLPTPVSAPCEFETILFIHKFERVALILCSPFLEFGLLIFPFSFCFKTHKGRKHVNAVLCCEKYLVFRKNFRGATNFGNEHILYTSPPHQYL